MSGLPIKYRVRLAYGFYSVGHVFVSPPFSRGVAQILVGRGLLEEINETPALPERKEKHGTAKNQNRSR